MVVYFGLINYCKSHLIQIFVVLLFCVFRIGKTIVYTSWWKNRKENNARTYHVVLQDICIKHPKFKDLDVNVQLKKK